MASSPVTDPVENSPRFLVGNHPREGATVWALQGKFSVTEPATVSEKASRGMGASDERRRRCESKPFPRSPLLEVRRETLETVSFGVAEEPASEWGEARTHDHREVEVARTPYDRFVEAARRFGDHPGERALDGFTRVERAALGSYERTDLRVGSGALVVVAVETRPGLLSQTARGHEERKDARRLRSISEGPREHHARLLGDVDPDLVEEPQRPHRHSEPEECPVHRLDVAGLEQKVRGFVQIRPEDPVHEKPRSVVHHHRGFSEPLRESDEGRDRSVGAGSAAGHLHQGHAIDGMEEVESRHASRMREDGLHLAHREGRGVSGDETVLQYPG